MAGSFLGNCLSSLFTANLLFAGCAIVLVPAFPIAQITLGAVYIYECPAGPLIPVYVMVCGILALLMMGLSALPQHLCPAAPSKTIWTLLIISLVLFIFIWFFYGSYLIYSIHPPNYTKTIINPNISNNSIYAPTAPVNKTGLTLENQNQSLPNLNQTWMINKKQTLRNLTQTLALSNISSETNRELLGTPQTHRVMAAVAVPYCDRTFYLFAFWTTTLVYVFAAHTLVIGICLYGCLIIGNIITKSLF